MQSLLSRAGLAHRCYCRSCGTAAEALGRRAAARPRRKATFAEIFTACYSSVFATAALVDAIRKDDRRQTLEQRLEEARRDLAEVQGRRPTDDTPRDADPIPQRLSLEQMDALWTSIKGIYIDRPFMKEIHKPPTITASTLVESLRREYYGCSGDPDDVAAARRGIDYERLERAIATEESDQRRWYRQPQTPDHLRMESISSEELVLKFLDRAKFLPESNLPSPSFGEARRIMRKGYPRYTFRAVDPAGAQADTTILNQRLRTLIASPEMSTRERIGRICYNLLVSAYPPDMHTYNTLIVAFNKSGHHTFAEALVSSFFHSRLLQPTPSTYVAILNHYKCTNNHGKFLRALACLTGLDPTLGGKIRRRHVRDIELSPLLQKWAADMTRRTQTGDWVWEHIPLNQPLVEEIICGLLHFKLFDQAVAFFVAAIHSGVKPSMRTAKLVMDESVEALDWRAAARMLRSLTRFQTRWLRWLSSADADSKDHLFSRIRVMVDLCGLNGPSRLMRLRSLRIPGPRFGALLKLMESEADLRPDSLGSVSGLVANSEGSESRLLQLESIAKELDHVRGTTMSIESKLLYPDFCDEFRVSMALQIGAAAIERAMQLTREFETLASESRKSLGDRGQDQDTDRDRRTMGLSAEVVESSRSAEGGPAPAAMSGQVRPAADSRLGGPLLALPAMRGGRAEEHAETWGMGWEG